MRLELPAQPPFSLQQVITSHGWPQLAPFQWDRSSGELRRVERLASGRVVELRFDQAPGGAAVEIDGNLSDRERAEVEAKVHWMLGLDQDFGAFYAIARHEPKLARAEVQAKGRVLRSPTLFEDVVKTIATTNTTWGGTIRMIDALVRLYGDPLPANPERKAFPTPERLASADLDSLRSQVKLGYRAPYVLALAQAVASGSLDLEALARADLPTSELRKRLLTIKGVGGYAAANLLVILGRYDYVPVDSWAMSQVSREWYDGRPVGEKEVNAAFEGWGEWRGLAFWCWEWSG